MSDFTHSQELAIAARGNVLVAAGAGTGKTRTLVERFIRLLLDRNLEVSAREILAVTFTEAAAAELRQRVREALSARQRESPADEWLAEQLILLDVAPIGTLHSFCYRLIREHFDKLGLDSQLAVMKDGQDKLVKEAVFTDLLAEYYSRASASAEVVGDLIDHFAGGEENKLRGWVFRLHEYSQTLPDPNGWIKVQLESARESTPQAWEEIFELGVREWKLEWRPELERLQSDANISRVIEILDGLPERNSRAELGGPISEIASFAETKKWNGRAGKVRDQFQGFWKDAKFLCSLLTSNDVDPLVQDWEWARVSLEALLKLTGDFAVGYARAKREQGVLDFHDLEQFALDLLWDREANQPTPLAIQARQRFKFIFVDEYQDINAAQDAILRALSRDENLGNRFLVGDVKQSIYRFRLANPRIFQDYFRSWKIPGTGGSVFHLSENFRSHPMILNFVNGVFSAVMREAVGGVDYDANAALNAGRTWTPGPGEGVESPRVTVHWLLRATEDSEANGEGDADKDENGNTDGPIAVIDWIKAEQEARLAAAQLRALKDSQRLIWDEATESLRPVGWGDMAILLRSVKNQASAYAREFERAGIPLEAPRGGFYDALEISDLVSLLRLLDNRLQDVPVLAVLRSPLVGLTLDDLAGIRAGFRDTLFWNALKYFHQNRRESAGWPKVDLFLARFEKWKRMGRDLPLSHRLEKILNETCYREWLTTRPFGERQLANVRRLLALTEEFDRFQRQGLWRFLDFVEAQEELDVEESQAAVNVEEAVTLQSIHASKGLEFPVVLLADLGRKFNFQDLNGDLVFDEEFGLCPKVRPPGRHSAYPSVACWMAKSRQRRETLGEELRLLYVAMTRAKELLLLVSSIDEKFLLERWPERIGEGIREAKVNSWLDWLGPWMEGQAAKAGQSMHDPAGAANLFSWCVHTTAAEMKESVASTADTVSSKGASKNEHEREPTAAEFEVLRDRVEWIYPFTQATAIPAKFSVTELRKGAAEDSDGSESDGARLFREGQRSPESNAGRKISAADVGLAHHRFMEHFDFTAVESTKALSLEADRLVSLKILTPDERSSMDLFAIHRFWQSKIGNELIGQKQFLRRELEFTARFTAGEIMRLGKNILNVSNSESGTDPWSTAVAGEFVIVQGVVDLAMISTREIWLVDFKTDQTTEAEIGVKADTYKVQLQSYAMALERIYGRPVTHKWLHFLRAGVTVEIE